MGWGWGWRWCASWCACTAGPWPRRRRGRGGGASSRSGCRRTWPPRRRRGPPSLGRRRRLRSRASPPRIHILLVEDNEDVAETLSEALGSLGHDVRVAHEGVAALAEAERWRPDLVLIDIGLPGMDGYELARRLRALPVDRPPVLMALTGYGQDEDRERSRSAGMDYHLTKPFALPQLEHLITQVLARARAGRPAAAG
ncbi:MAG: response regulator [Anaeromyxobacter sp.]